MKNLRITAFCVCITLYSLCSSAQTQSVPINEPDYNRPKLFANLPDKIPVSLDKITSLFGEAVGRSVNISLTQNQQFQFEGEVISKISKYQNTIQSVVIRSTNFNGAILSVSRTTTPDGDLSYTGRIISFRHGDAYQLQKQADGFVLVKKGFYDLVNE